MADSGSFPAAPPRTPGFPNNPTINVFDTFATLNTKPLRPGIEDEQMSWCDGFMPLGKNNLRTLYGIGTALYTAAMGLTIPYFDFGNLQANPYVYVFLSDGSVIQRNTSTLVDTTVAVAGTLTSTNIGLAQHGNSEIIFVTDQTNGYFVWDGTVLYTTGTLGPSADVDITNGGSGYTSAPTVGFSGGSGSGAAATAVITDDAVTSIIITNAGTGYTGGETVTLTFSGGGGTGAAATLLTMPSGISGTAVETYSGSVWVVNGEKGFFSAPGSVIDFTEANGGGNFVSSDSFLRVGYTALKQSNGFLYLMGDSSLNYISGVRTSGDPATTTFSNLNIDPQIGTPYPYSVQVFSRNIVFASSLGVYVSYGGAVTKISDNLDGIYNTVPNFGGLSLSAAVANIFNVPVYMVLVPIIDPFTSQQVNKLCMWDSKRWWTSPQEVNLRLVRTQEINSVLSAFGSNGTSIFPLFNQPSNELTKVVQSKLFENPSYIYQKTVQQVFYMMNFFTNSSESVTIDVDNEFGSAQSKTVVVGENGITWTNNADQPIEWTNNVGDPIVWFGPGLTINRFTSGQAGKVVGLTVQTLVDDMAILSMTMLDQVRQQTW